MKVVLIALTTVAIFGSSCAMQNQQPPINQQSRLAEVVRSFFENPVSRVLVSGKSITSLSLFTLIGILYRRGIDLLEGVEFYLFAANFLALFYGLRLMNYEETHQGQSPWEFDPFEEID